MIIEYSEKTSKSSSVVESRNETIGQCSSCVPLSTSDSTEHSERRLGMTTISAQDQKYSVTDNPTSFDTLFRSLTRMSFRASDACSCSISTLLADMSRDKGLLYDENCNNIDLIESVDGDLIIIDKGLLSNRGRHDEEGEKTDDDDIDDDSHDKVENSPDLLLLSDHGRNLTGDESYVSLDDFSAHQFERIGRMLIEETQSISDITTTQLENDLSMKESSMQDSCFNLVSQDELEKFTDAAKEILPHLVDFEAESHAPLLSPLLLPTGCCNDDIKEVDCHDTERLVSILPPEFICPLCQLPIVGAMSFSCIQNHSFCTSCVEKNYFLEDQFLKGNTRAYSSPPRDDDCSMFCPMCKEHCNHAPCHALDVAILRFMRDFDLYAKRLQETQPLLTLDLKSLAAFQARFYERDLAWRTEVRTRKVLNDHKKQSLLLEYAQFEKEEMLKFKEKTMQQNAWMHFAAAVVSIPIAVFMGTHALRRLH